MRQLPVFTKLMAGLKVSERLLDYDPLSGAKQWFSYDEDTDTMRIRYEEDVSATLDYNKSKQAESFDKRDDVWHAAKIPNTVIMKWKLEHGVELWNPDHKEGVRRLLNSDEYRYLRVHNFIM